MLIKNYEFMNVNTTLFSPSREFDFNAPGPLEKLRSSISETGIIYPLIALPNEDGLVIIDGFKRYQIALDLRCVSIPTMVLPNSVNLFEAIKLRYDDLKYQRDDLNILQKMTIYQLLLKNQAGDSKIDWWVRRMNLPADRNLLSKTMRILTWPQHAQIYLHHYHVSLQNIRALLDQNNSTITELFHFAITLSIRPVELNEIYNYCNDIALNSNKNFTDIIRHPDIMAILENSIKNRNQKLVAIKRLLYQWRFPLISHYQKTLDQKLSDLAFPSNFNMAYDKQFENSELVLQIRINNEESLLNAIKVFSDDKKMTLLKSIIDLI